jgi:hypothetical protein
LPNHGAETPAEPSYIRVQNSNNALTTNQARKVTHPRVSEPAAVAKRPRATRERGWAVSASDWSIKRYLEVRV